MGIHALFRKDFEGSEREKIIEKQRKARRGCPPGRVRVLPLLLDREVDLVTAMIASVRSAIGNPRPMLGWGISVALPLFVAALPVFLGLAAVLPVLGHTTWHLYRKPVV